MTNQELSETQKKLDAISRQAIIKALNEMDRYVSEELRLCNTDKKFPKNEVFIVDDVYEEIVENLSSAQPEIVRCKDCKLFGHPKCLMYFNGYDWAEPDGYCYMAERR